MNTSRRFTLLLLCIISLWSCDNDESLKDPWIGEWALTRVTGGFTGLGYTPDFNILILDGDGTFEVRANNTLIESGKFETMVREDIPRISFSTDTVNQLSLFLEPEKSLTIEEGNLILWDPCCDMFNYMFTPLQ